MYSDNESKVVNLLPLAINLQSMFEQSHTPLIIEIPMDSSEDIAEAFHSEWRLFIDSYLRYVGYKLIPITHPTGELRNPRYYYNSGTGAVIKVDSISPFRKVIEKTSLSEAIPMMSEQDIGLNEILDDEIGLRGLDEYSKRYDELFQSSVLESD